MYLSEQSVRRKARLDEQMAANPLALAEAGQTAFSAPSRSAALAAAQADFSFAAIDPAAHAGDDEQTAQRIAQVLAADPALLSRNADEPDAAQASLLESPFGPQTPALAASDQAAARLAQAEQAEQLDQDALLAAEQAAPPAADESSAAAEALDPAALVAAASSATSPADDLEDERAAPADGAGTAATLQRKAAGAADECAGVSHEQPFSYYVDRLVDQLQEAALDLEPAFAKGKARQAIEMLLTESLRQGIKNRNHVAYILATAHHESNMGKNMRELGDDSYFEQYEGRLGNERDGDGKRYRGRGYVQITGKDNYEKYAELLKKKRGVKQSLVANPDLAADPELAAFITVHGMTNGGFTGKKLSDFNQKGGGFDEFNARSIVNGDKNLTSQRRPGQKMGSYLEDISRKYLGILKEHTKDWRILLCHDWD